MAKDVVVAVRVRAVASVAASVVVRVRAARSQASGASIVRVMAVASVPLAAAIV